MQKVWVLSMIKLFVEHAAIAAFVVAIYSVALLGFTYIIGQATISKPIRELIAPEEDDAKNLAWMIRMWIVILLECSMCAGTWVGGIVGGALSYTLKLGAWETIATIVVLASYSCGSNYILTSLINRKEHDHGQGTQQHDRQ